MLTGEQVRAARALLRLEQTELAERSGVSLPSIKRFEAMTGAIHARAVTVEKIRRALETLGAIFIPSNGEGPGVRLKRTKKDPAA